MLKQFGLLRFRLPQMPGLLFGRAMGCGLGAAFSLRPDWNRYAVLIESASVAEQEAIISSQPFDALKSASVVHRQWNLAPFRKHGRWKGKDPFALTEDADAGGPVAVLTRANISPVRLPGFIRHSYQTTKALAEAPGLMFSIGMGEYPLIRQATLTMWESDDAMKAYAYKSPDHIAAMKAKAAQRMFSEEMFVRFRIIGQGSTTE